MSIREVLKLSKGTTEDNFGPVLVSVFESLCRDLAERADRFGVSLENVEAFSLKTTDWQQSMMLLYESLYSQDCMRVKRQNKAFSSNKRGLPDNLICYSKALDPVIDFLHERRVRLSGDSEESNYFGNKKRAIQEQIQNDVFGTIK